MRHKDNLSRYGERSPLHPFRPGDILMVQRFSVDGIIKQYELQVVTAKVGDTSKGEERLDSITYKNFVGDEGSVVFS